MVYYEVYMNIAIWSHFVDTKPSNANSIDDNHSYSYTRLFPCSFSLWGMFLPMASHSPWHFIWCYHNELLFYVCHNKLILIEEKHFYFESLTCDHLHNNTMIIDLYLELQSLKYLFAPEIFISMHYKLIDSICTNAHGFSFPLNLVAHHISSA